MVIICGLKQVLEEMELVLGDGGIDQLLSYDTTFTMGDFYVSILILPHGRVKPGEPPFTFVGVDYFEISGLPMLSVVAAWRKDTEFFLPA